MSKVVNCILNHKISKSLAARIIESIDNVQKDDFYKVINVYNSADELVESIPVRSKIQYWRELGRINGYPPCCVEEFINDKLAGRNPSVRGSSNGYVPCSECKNKETNSNECIVVTVVDNTLVVE